MKTKLDEIAEFWSKEAMLDNVDIAEFVENIKPMYDELIVHTRTNTNEYFAIYDAFYNTMSTYVNTIANIVKSKSMSDIKAGDHFEYNGLEWVCLKVPHLVEKNNAIFAVSAKIINFMHFSTERRDGCNNWRTSSIRSWLNGEFRDKNFENGALLKQRSDLTADNGDDKYGVTEDYITLISCDQYRRYRKLMPKYDDWVWTFTPHSCSVGVASYVRGVSPSGELGGSGAGDTLGVAPACLFDFDYLKSCPQARLLSSNTIEKRGGN